MSSLKIVLGNNFSILQIHYTVNMAESQVQKKNKKGKKKLDISEVSALSVDKNIKTSFSLNCDPCDKTFENADEAGPTEKKVDVDESTGKKKKKSKKKSKEASKETYTEKSSENSLLNYSENGIHLVNHPEISVTITDSCMSNDNEIKSAEDKIPEFDDKKQNNNSTINNSVVAAETADCNNTSKKKKKKKKKTNNDNLPVTTTTSNENTFATPTYTKVVTSDNTCVLVVNNEKFSIDAKSLENMESGGKQVSDNSINFSIPSEKQLGDVLLTKSFTSDTNMQLSNSVSIFPVLPNGDANSFDPPTETTVNIKAGLITEIKGNEPTVQENLNDSKPTKSQLKAERRAKQEAQRAAKLAKSTAKVDTVSNENKTNVPKESDLKSTETTTETLTSKVPVEKESLHKVKLFSHLPQCKKFDINTKIHPAILEIGFQYNKGIICGSNARCVALLEAFVEVIKDFVPQPDKNFLRDLESNIQSYLTFLGNCRPLSVSMMNAVRFLKHEINQISSDVEINEIKDRLCGFICNFIKVEIVLAKEAIANRTSYKIIDGDVILVLGYSSVIKDVLCKAYEKKKIFRVIIVDTRPKQEGLKMLRNLVKQGLQCSYISINAVSYIMKEVTKFIIGAHAILANGCVMSRLGNKQISLVALTYGVPVFVCCETYKFCERVLTDSFVHNELGEPEDIITTSLALNDSLKNWHDLPLLQPLNLLYDLTTPNLVAEIVTEKGTLPCTSVPVFLRVRFAGLSQ